MARYCGSCEFWFNRKCCNPMSNFRGSDMIDPTFKCPIPVKESDDLVSRVANDIVEIKEHILYGNDVDINKCQRVIIECIKSNAELADSGDLEHYFYFAHEINSLISKLKRKELKRYHVKYVPFSL